MPVGGGESLKELVDGPKCHVCESLPMAFVTEDESCFVVVFFNQRVRVTVCVPIYGKELPE